ncbi:MAG: PDZ domain-containing protein [Abditibacteriota bacterium]|nr:PDZ domain-containing protein [Abditibacteriota bacterium]
MFNKKTRAALMLFIFLVGLLMGCSLVNKQIRKASDPLDHLSASTDGALSTLFNPTSTFYAVMRAMNTEYVEKITPEFETRMSVNLVKGMLREMGDQNTRYVEPEEAALLINAEKGDFEGIGIRSRIIPTEIDGIREEQLHVGSVIPGSNAYKAGLKDGDIILSVNGKDVLPYNPLARAEKALNEYRMKPDITKQKQLQKYLDDENARVDKGVMILEAEKQLERGSEGHFVLAVKRGSEQKTVEVDAGKYHLDIIETKDIAGYKYIRINYISGDLKKALSGETSDAGKGLILDLRDVFGGSSEGTSDALSLFLPSRTLYRVSAQKSRLLRTPACSEPCRAPVMVLVNSGTSRMSEIMAASLKAFYPDTVICGEATEGDFTELTYFGLDNGGGYTMTSGKYMTLANKEPEPVSPDVAFSGDTGVLPDSAFIAKAFGR